MQGGVAPKTPGLEGAERGKSSPGCGQQPQDSHPQRPVGLAHDEGIGVHGLCDQVQHGQLVEEAGQKGGGGGGTFAGGCPAAVQRKWSQQQQQAQPEQRAGCLGEGKILWVERDLFDPPASDQEEGCGQQWRQQRTQGACQAVCQGARFAVQGSGGCHQHTQQDRHDQNGRHRRCCEEGQRSVPAQQRPDLCWKGGRAALLQVEEQCRRCDQLAERHDRGVAGFELDRVPGKLEGGFQVNAAAGRQQPDRAAQVERPEPQRQQGCAASPCSRDPAPLCPQPVAGECSCPVHSKKQP